MPQFILNFHGRKAGALGRTYLCEETIEVTEECAPFFRQLAELPSVSEAKTDEAAPLHLTSALFDRPEVIQLYDKGWEHISFASLRPSWLGGPSFGKLCREVK